MTRADVLVVGGGPAGATLAILVAQAGASVVVLERRAFPRDKVCGEFVSAEGIGVLTRLGVLEDLVGAGARSMDSVRITNLAGREVRAPLPELNGVGRNALGVSRALLDQVLLDRARRAGARVRERVEAAAPVIEDGRVVGLRIRPVGTVGRAETLLANLVVAADGRRSVLGRALHPRMGDPDRTRANSWFGLKTHLAADPDRLEGRVELHLFPGGYAGLGSVEGDRINLCVMATVAALRSCGGTPEHLVRQRVLLNPAARDAIGAMNPCGGWHTIGPLRFGVRRPTAAGALFVGDAAGTIDPFCGDGIAQALLGAETATPVALEAASRGSLSHELAATYADSWNRAFGGVTRRVRWLGRAFEGHRRGGALVALLGGIGKRIVPGLVAATRTGVRR